MFRRLGLLAVVVASHLNGGLALGQVPAPDFDVYDVISSPQPEFTYLRFSGPTTLALDFFYPGSDPFIGDVPMFGDTFMGNPVVMHRPLGGGLLTFVPPSSDVIPIELVALNLVGANPVPVTGARGDELWELHFSLSGPPSVGQLNITRTSAQGGIFDAQIPFQSQITFTNLNDPLEQVQTLYSGMLVASGEPWTLGPGNRFLPGVDPFGGPAATPVVFEDIRSGSRIGLSLATNSVPEPGSWALWLCILGAAFAGHAGLRAWRVGGGQLAAS